MFRPHYDKKLLLEKCRSIHTCWMFFSIDVICLDDSNTVICCKRNLKPWRIFFAPPETRAIIEMESGSCDADEYAQGESLRVVIE